MSKNSPAPFGINHFSLLLIIALCLRFTNTDLLIYWMSVEWFCIVVMAVLHIKCYLIIKCVLHTTPQCERTTLNTVELRNIFAYL